MHERNTKIEHKKLVMVWSGVIKVPHGQNWSSTFPLVIKEKKQIILSLILQLVHAGIETSNLSP